MKSRSILGIISFYLSVSLLLLSCSHQLSPKTDDPTASQRAFGVNGPPCIIYRTRSDYSMYVPVSLSSDKDKIVSYPDIKDIYFNDKLSVPTSLADGFLLDNRGIGVQVGFLSYTYEKYSKLSATPNAKDLMGLLLDKDPLVEMYQCGQRSQYKDIEQELNVLITSGKLNTCKKLK